MKCTGRYCPTNDGYDLDSEIDLFVDKAKELVKAVECSTPVDKNVRAILRAIATTIVDNIE